MEPKKDIKFLESIELRETAHFSTGNHFLEDRDLVCVYESLIDYNFASQSLVVTLFNRRTRSTNQRFRFARFQTLENPPA